MSAPPLCTCVSFTKSVSQSFISIILFLFLSLYKHYVFGEFILYKQFEMLCPDSGDMSPGEFLDTVRDQLGDEAARQIEKLLKQGLSMKVRNNLTLWRNFSPL